MNSNKRLLEALSGGAPDRIPYVPKIWVDLAASLTGTDLVEVIRDPETALSVIAVAGADLGVDAVRQFHFPRKRIEVEDDGVYQIDDRGSRIGVIDIKGGLGTHLYDAGTFRVDDPRYMAYHSYYLADSPFVTSVSDAARISVPEKTYYEEVGCGDRQRKVMGEVGDSICYLGDCGSATMAFLVTMRGMNRALFDLIEEPQLVHTVMEKGAEIAVEKGKFNIDLGLRILRLNDSVGNMSVISPKHWREYIFPHMKDVCTELHRYDPGVKIYCHVCGNVMPIIGDLKATGLDCISPLDPLGGFSCAQAREAAGEGFPLMGGVNTLSFVNSSVEEITAEALECMKGAGGNGAFILGSGCVVPRTANRENLACLADLVRDSFKFQVSGSK